MLQRYKSHFKTTLLSLFRAPGYWVPTVLFPVMLYSMFGASLSNAAISSFVMASFCAYAVIGVGFYQFGVSIAQDRETSWERFQRVLPRVFWPKILSRLFAAGVFALIAILLVVVAAEIMAKPSATAFAVFKMVMVALAIVLPFSLFGVALGYWTSARAAVPIANMIFLPLAYLGGLWTHPSKLPEIIQTISQFTPTRHAAEILWAVIGEFPVPSASIYWLAGYSALFALLAWLGYRRDEANRYG